MPCGSSLLLTLRELCPCIVRGRIGDEWVLGEQRRGPINMWRFVFFCDSSPPHKHRQPHKMNPYTLAGRKSIE